MKNLSILILFFSSFAEASYFATFCSNAKQTISYESGHNSNSITFQENETTRKVSLGDITLDTLENLTLSEKVEHQCGYYSVQKKYVAKIKITEGDKDVTDYFICEYNLNSRAPCPQEDAK